MYENIIEKKGHLSGPVSIVLGGVHGNECCGVEALFEISQSVVIEKGIVIFAYGNPLAIDKGVRFVDVNLNRMFKNDILLSEKEKSSYEYRRAQVLKVYISKASGLLDIHASNTPGSEPFIIAEENARALVESMPVKKIVSGFDNLEPGGTDFYMNSIGGIGICVECGFVNDPQSTIVAKESIQSFLVNRGHVSGETQKNKKTYIKMTDLYHTKTDMFSLVRQFADFESIKKGDLIGTDGEEEVFSSTDGVILFARNSNKKDSEAFLLGQVQK